MGREECGTRGDDSMNKQTHLSKPTTPRLFNITRTRWQRGSRDARGAQEQRRMIGSSQQPPESSLTQRQRHVRQQDAPRVFPATRMRWMRDRQPCAENRVFGRVARGHALAGRVAGACRREKAGILGWLRD